MRQYIIRRLLLVIPTLLGISIIVFMMLHLVPGSVVDIIISQAVRSGNIGAATVMDVEEIKRAFGLDVPIYVQYGRWIGDIVFRGSLGDSLIKNVPVTDLIIGKLAVTVELGLLAVLFSNIISFPIRVFSAIRQDSVADYLGRTVAILFMAVPSFWVATIIMIYPSIWWKWSPSLDLVPFMDNPLGNLKVFLIPSFLLGMAMAGDNMRMTRTMMLEVLRQDYIRTAYSKGLREGVVVLRHALKNALIPVVTLIGAELPVMIGGSIIIEQIFALPGTGRFLIQALEQRDYTVVAGINLVIATVVVVVNLIVDLSYGFLDPRVRYN